MNLSGRNIEHEVDPNVPVDFLLPSAGDTENLEDTASPTVNTPLNLRLRRKPTIKWSISVHVDNNRTRNIIVDAFTTVRDVSKIVSIIEGKDIDEIDSWSIWFEPSKSNITLNGCLFNFLSRYLMQ
jgi:hypothetical protein